MPVYEYLCNTCGDFAVLRPMAQAAFHHACPDCGAEAPRALLSAPAIAGLPQAQRRAREINERSAHAPKESSKTDPKSHGAGCGCCKAVGKSSTRTAPNGAKAFPSRRPWMIGH
jgi:putative FmdB family regulatory protein